MMLLLISINTQISTVSYFMICQLTVLYITAFDGSVLCCDVVFVLSPAMVTLGIYPNH